MKIKYIQASPSWRASFQNVENENDFKRRWDESAVNGPYSRAPSYESVKVLLLSWKECCDNLPTGEEVDRLEHVFKNKFHYDTQREYLCRHKCIKVQVQLNYIVSGFVNVPQGPNTLFIVYYAGHAIPTNNSREMLMHTG